MAISFGAKAVDRTYTSGPEILAARSSSILAGPVEAYGKKILTTSQPPGPDAAALKWVATGRVDQPTLLKGRATGPVSFARTEQSLLLPLDRHQEEWELQYGEIVRGGKVVVFIASDADPSTGKAIPSGVGELDLVALVRDVVALQARPSHELEAAWLSYLLTAPLEQGRKAALRTLVQRAVPWSLLSGNLDQVLATRTISAGMREFTFGIVVFGLGEDRWTADQTAVADFLCRHFEREQQPGLLLSYMLLLKLAVKYSMEEATRSVRQPLRTRLVGCLKRRESGVSQIPELAEQYRQLRATYPGLL